MRYAVVTLCALLGACQTAPKNPQDELVWVRTDNKKIASNPKLKEQLQLDIAVCKGETQKAAVGMAPIYYRGIGGAISAGVIENQRSNALGDVARGCMASKGYLRMTRGEADLRAAANETTPKRRPDRKPS